GRGDGRGSGGRGRGIGEIGVERWEEGAQGLFEALERASILAEFGAQLAEKEVAARNVLAALAQPFDLGEEPRASLRGQLPQIPPETFDWGFVAGHHSSADKLGYALHGKRPVIPLAREASYIFR